MHLSGQSLMRLRCVQAWGGWERDSDIGPVEIAHTRVVLGGGGAHPGDSVGTYAPISPRALEARSVDVLS